MNNRYKYSESSVSLKKQPNLDLEQSSSPRLRVFRLLSGTTSITDTYANKKYKLTNAFTGEKTTTVSDSLMFEVKPHDCDVYIMEVSD